MKHGKLYAAADCLKNADSGETFIIGHMSDAYPEFSAFPAIRIIACSLRVLPDGSPFLRIVDEKKRLSDYKQEYR